MSSPRPDPYIADSQTWTSGTGTEYTFRDDPKSNKSYPTHAASDVTYEHPDIRSPGLQSVWSDDQGKEVVPQHMMPQEQQPFYPYYQAVDGHDPEAQPGGRRICGIPRMLALVIIAFLIILFLGFGLGLGLGLGLKKSSTSGGPDPSPFNPAFLSKEGAFNGSGIALAGQSFDDGGYGVINLYFQHWSGQLRKMQLQNDGTWEGGDSTNIIATDAKNATPISAVSYAMDNKARWHIFYIDKDNYIRERIADNTTNQWREGPLRELGLKAMDHANVGLQACWYGSFYGTANFTHSPVPGTGRNDTSPDSVIGIHLWYGRESHVLEEINWTYNTSEWYRQDNFTANGHAGVGCFSWGPGSVSYVMTVNLNNEINLRWKDLNISEPATSSHPTGEWVNSSVVIPHVMANTSLGYTNYFYTQLDDRSIGGYNISFDAEDSKILDEYTFTIPRKPLAGTHFSVTAIKTPSGGDSLLVFNQKNGTDITVDTRDLSAGQWTYNALEIPDS